MTIFPIRIKAILTLALFGVAMFGRQSVAATGPDLASIARRMCVGGPAHSLSLARASKASVDAASDVAAKLQSKTVADEAVLAARAATSSEHDSQKKPAPVAQVQLLVDAASTADKNLANAQATKALADAATAHLANKLATLCGNANGLAAFADKQLPRQFFARSAVGDLCAPLGALSPSDDTENAVAQICTHSSERSLSIASVGVDLIQGFGDFLEGEAKQEMSSIC